MRDGGNLDLFAGRRRGWLVGALLVATSVAAFQLMRTMTDDLHRVMFGAAAGVLALAAIVAVIAITRR